MLLITKFLKSKRVDKPRGSLKVIEDDIEGGISKKGYDLETGNDVRG